MTIVLVDEHGVRHEVDFPLRTLCGAWMVTATGGDMRGHARFGVIVRTQTPIYEMGRHGAIGFITGQDRVEFSGSEVPFGPSDEPITCIECLRGEP